MFELYDEEEEKVNIGVIYVHIYDYSIRVLGIEIGMIKSPKLVSRKNLYMKSSLPLE